MHTVAILYPAFALAFLTFGVAIWLLYCRIKAVRAGLTLAYFRLNHGARLPDYLVQATQHYDNLFEMPVLFYVVVTFAYITRASSLPLVVLAWLYIAVRAVHTYIHLGSNTLRLRRNVFLLSYGILLLMWLWLLGLLLLLPNVPSP
jgi:hypothetical protein